MNKIDFSFKVDKILKQINSLKDYNMKVKYKPKCRICKEHCIARNSICPSDCGYNNKGFCNKYNIELELFEDLYFRCEDCYDGVVNKYLKDKLE